MAQKQNKLNEIVPVAIILDGEGSVPPGTVPPPVTQKPRLKIDNTFFLMISPETFLDIG